MDDFGKSWWHWLLVLGAIALTIYLTVSLVSIIKGWTVGEGQKASNKAIGYFWASPFIMAAVVGMTICFASLFGWFTSISSSAAVIIVLLALILLSSE